jgi:hypothetical protein
MVDSDGKREYIRINNEFNVRLVKKDEKHEKGNIEINTSKSINISGSGLLVNVDRKLDVGTIVNISFMKPNTFDFFKGTGKVVRVEEDTDKSFKVGINFIDLTPDDKNMLDYYINRKGQ